MIVNRKGTIINIASLAVNTRSGTMYGATKHALLGFTKSYARSARIYIRVVAICPVQLIQILIRTDQ
jgi:NAD(P)-dependent dehydrogenase (short-subunit alcohol dehydrogenase family)